MNFLLAVVTTGLVVAVSEISAHPVHIQDRNAFLYRHHKDCLTVSGLDKKYFSHPEDAIKSEDPKLKEYLGCFLKKSGYMNELGELHEEMIRKQLTGLYEDNSNVEVVVKECVVTKVEPLESAFGFYKCYHKHYPQEGFLFRVNHIPEEIHNKIRAHYNHCSKESGVPKEILQKACKGDFSEDVLLKKFSYCFVQRIGFQNEEGKILENVVREKLSEMVLDDSQNDILIEKCLKEGSNPEDTAFGFMKCFVKNSHFNVLRNSLSSEKKEELAQIHKDCRKESAIEDELIEKFKQGDFQDHPLGKKHLYCVYKATGHMDEFGGLKEDKMRKTLSDYYDSGMIDQYMNKCLIKKNSAEETAYYMHSCFYETTPHKFNIFSVL